MARKFDIEDDSLAAILWRAERWAKKPKKYGPGLSSANAVPNCATRASHDRELLIQLLRRIGKA